MCSQTYGPAPYSPVPPSASNVKSSSGTSAGIVIGQSEMMRSGASNATDTSSFVTLTPAGLAEAAAEASSFVALIPSGLTEAAADTKSFVTRNGRDSLLKLATVAMRTALVP